MTHQWLTAAAVIAALVLGRCAVLEAFDHIDGESPAPANRR